MSGEAKPEDTGGLTIFPRDPKREPEDPAVVAARKARFAEEAAGRERAAAEYAAAHPVVSPIYLLCDDHGGDGYGGHDIIAWHADRAVLEAEARRLEAERYPSRDGDHSDQSKPEYWDHYIEVVGMVVPP